MNINLNAGGIIGAILGGGGVLLYWAFAFNGGPSATSAQIDSISSHFSRALICAVIAGTIFGTMLWGFMFIADSVDLAALPYRPDQRQRVEYN